MTPKQQLEYDTNTRALAIRAKVERTPAHKRGAYLRWLFDMNRDMTPLTRRALLLSRQLQNMKDMNDIR